MRPGRDRPGELTHGVLAAPRRVWAISTDAARPDSWAFNGEAHRFIRAQGLETSRLVLERRL
ncbi:hypothetical protein ACT3TZ_14090 [Brachybacterium sp. AOP25-B2-12]|uniref:hypothetical protein n=1 Tax=Brachybacterium sp. AOP25-B2-12 TaxID=3457710 RepID=UPI00403494ED